MSVICFYVSFYHMFIFVKHKKDLINFTFAFCCFFIAVYDAFCVGLYNSSNFNSGMFWQRLQFVTLNFLSISVIWFIYFFIKQKTKIFSIILTAVFSILIILQIIINNELTLSITNKSFKIVQIGNFYIEYYEVEPGLILKIQYLFIIIGMIYLIIIIIKYHNNIKRKYLFIFSAAFISFFMGVVNDLLVALSIYNFFYITEYVYLLIILMMSYILIDKFVNTTIEMENFNKILEIRVSERTKKIQEAYEEIKKLANEDHLTKLPNRRIILQRLELEKNRYERKIKNNKRKIKYEFCIAILDIDDFKIFNDKYGHECGDNALIHLANLLKSIIRKQDDVARWGGEEFLLVFPETDYEGAKVITEKIRKKVEETIFKYNYSTIRITITIGTVVYQNIELDIDQCIKNADSALYQGKKKGKNCVVIKKYYN